MIINHFITDHAGYETPISSNGLRYESKMAAEEAIRATQYDGHSAAGYDPETDRHWARYPGNPTMTHYWWVAEITD